MSTPYTLIDTRQIMLTPPDWCDHDGRASGQLVLEERGFRGEVVCECGSLMAFLWREEYEFNARPAPHGPP